MTTHRFEAGMKHEYKIPVINYCTCAEDSVAP